MKHSYSTGQWQYPMYNALGQRVEDYQGVDPMTLTYPVDISGRRTGAFAQWPSQNWTGWNVYWARVAGQHISMGGADSWLAHADAIDSTTMVTDETGAWVWDQVFGPWGEVWQQTGTRPWFVFAGLRWPVNDPLYPSASREYSEGVGRWMTPDPGGLKVVKLDNPQTWNMYAYVGNNPTSRNDPSGLYTVECGSDDQQCSKAAQRFENQRLKDLASKNADVRAAAQAWGGPTDKNGITVTFKTQAQVDADAGNLDTAHYRVDAIVTPGATNDHKPDIRAEFSEGLGGSGLRQTIAHEGSHLEDDLAFLNSFNPATGAYNGALNFYHFDTEFKAFETGSGVKPYPMFRRGPNGYFQLEMYLWSAPSYRYIDYQLVFPKTTYPQ